MNEVTTHPAKNILCHRCNRGFSRQEHLQRHERSRKHAYKYSIPRGSLLKSYLDTKEKPFKCSRCPKSFTRKYERVAGLKHCHWVSNAKLRDLLTRHSRLTHPAAPQNVQPRLEEDLSSASTLVAYTDISPQGLLHSAEQYAHSQDLTTTLAVHSEEGNQFQPDEAHRKSVEDSLAFDVDNSLTEINAPAFAQDFASFIDMVRTPGHPFSPAYQPLPVFFPDLNLPLLNGFEDQRVPEDVEGISASVRLAAPQRVTTYQAGEAGCSLSRYGSRLPSLQPEETAEQAGRHSVNHNTGRFVVTNEFRQQIIEDISKFPGCFDAEFVLPSRHTLTRLVNGYFKNFHEHYPFLHLPTLRLETLLVELLLALAALGARYTRETEVGAELFHVARAIALERCQRCNTNAEGNVYREEQEWRGPFTPDISNPSSPKSRKTMFVEMTQTVLMLIAIATWYKYEPGATNALSLRSVLHSLVRELEVTQQSDQHWDDWEAWIQFETIKRTQLVVFCFFNIHTILFDLPPMQLASAIRLDLPCSETVWRATDEQLWRDARRTSNIPREDFQGVLAELFANDDQSFDASSQAPRNLSALGGYGIIHAIIQQIWLTRNARLPSQQRYSRLSAEDMNMFESALKRWARYWERNQESSLNPLSPHGPVTFTSTALLRLAYIRLNLNLGPVRCLDSWDPALVARSIHQSQGVERHPQLTRAALHCAHALSIPVKLGINYVATTQLINWSNQHALCSLECAILLAKWLELITKPDPSPPLTAAEQVVLKFVIELVAETEYKRTVEQIAHKKQYLAAKIVRLWARLHRADSVWQVVNVIGESLNIYADLLEP